MKAKDLMEPVDEYLSPETPLREAVIRMSRCKRHHGLSVKGMLVLNKQKQLVGMLSIKDIMGAVIPTYLSPDLSVFSWDNMLEQMTERCKGKKVGDVMVTKLYTITGEATLMMCVDLMIRKSLQRLPVLDKDKNILGMVYIRDLYDFIANILTEGGSGNDNC